jgi:hypothetical protein
VVDPQRRAAGQAAQLGQECELRGIGGLLGVAAQPFQHMGAPFREVQHPRRDAVGVHRQAQQVDRRAQQGGRDAGQQRRHGAVRRDHRPVAVDRQRREGLVRRQHLRDHGAGGRHLRIVIGSFREVRREAGGGQQHVALAQRHLELLGQVQQHVAARAGAARFQEAEVPLRDLRLAGQRQLAEAPAAAPFADQAADIAGHRCHGPIMPPTARGGDYPRGHRRAARGRRGSVPRVRGGHRGRRPRRRTVFMDAIVTTNRAATLRPAPLLRFALLADSAASGAVGLLVLLGGPALAGLLGLPAALLQGAGLLLLPYAAFVWWLSRRDAMPAWWAWTVIGVNLAWVADSGLLLLSGWVAPTGLGVAFVLAQAAAVLGFALLQWAGLRRSRG